MGDRIHPSNLSHLAAVLLNWSKLKKSTMTCCKASSVISIAALAFPTHLSNIIDLQCQSMQGRAAR